jgi:hypothetical protein
MIIIAGVAEKAMSKAPIDRPNTAVRAIQRSVTTPWKPFLVIRNQLIPGRIRSCQTMTNMLRRDTKSEA